MTWNCQALLHLRHLLGLWCYWNWRILLLTLFRTEIFLLKYVERSLMISPHNMRYTRFLICHKILQNHKIVKQHCKSGCCQLKLSGASWFSEDSCSVSQTMIHVFNWTGQRFQQRSLITCSACPNLLQFFNQGPKRTTSVSVSSPDPLTEKTAIAFYYACC